LTYGPARDPGPNVDAAKANGELREQLDPEAVADWLVPVAQMLLMDHLAGAQLRHSGHPQPHRCRRRDGADTMAMRCTIAETLASFMNGVGEKPAGRLA
jgi:hypothetical protein